MVSVSGDVMVSFLRRFKLEYECRLGESLDDDCSFQAGCTAVLSWCASRMWALLCLSSLPVAVVTAYERGVPTSLPFTAAGFHLSDAGS